MTRRISLWGPVVLYMAALFILSAQPDVPMPPGLTDKPTHSLAYTVLGVLFVRALAGGLPARVTGRIALLAVVLTTAYGVTDEFHQMFVPGRYSDWTDVIADAIGGMAGAGLCWVWGIILPALNRSEGPPRHGL